MLNCEDKIVGIGSLIYKVPPTCVPLEEYLLQPRTPFSVEEMLEHWSDFVIEPEHLYRFFCEQTTGTGDGVCDAIQDFNGITAVYVSGDTASDLALQVGRNLIGQRPDLVRNTQFLIYYSSSLNSNIAWSTPCRLQFELGLRGTGAFMVGQKGTISSFAALQVAAETLCAEEETDTLILVGSERLIPPQPRVFSNVWVHGDSASAMVVSSRSFEYRLLGISIEDSTETFLGANASEWYIAAAAAALQRMCQSAGICPSDIDAVIPPNCSLPFLQRIAEATSIPWARFYQDALPRFGFLGNSDLAVNLSCAAGEGKIRANDLVLAFGISVTGSIGCATLRYEPDRWTA